ncbi:MAG: arginase [Eubacteriales bacterium]
MNLDIIGVPTYYGIKQVGTDLAPAVLRHTGLLKELQILGHSVADKGDVDVQHLGTHDEIGIQPINHVNHMLYGKVLESLKGSRLPIVLGGDHSVAIGSALAAQSYYKNIGILWIDAHSDYNTFQTSQTGRIHGMPLAAITGIGKKDLSVFKPENIPYVDPSKCVVIANRSVDELELKLINENKLNVFTMADIDAIGIKGVMDKALEIVKNGTEGYHLSFDMDAVTPEEAPGVGTPVRGGLTFRESHLIAEMIAEDKKLLSMDFVEFNPMLDMKNQTGQLTISLIAAVMGKRFTVPLTNRS